MAIALRGTPTTGSAINGGNITLTLPTGLVAGDAVLVGFAMNAAGTGGTSSTGWTQVGGNLGATTRIQIFGKVMGASPDASIVLTGTANAADASTAIAIAFSGVDNGNPLTVSAVGATATSTNPDPAAIVPNVPNSVAVYFAATSLVDVTGTAGPAGYSDFTQISSSDTNSCTSYLGWKALGISGVSENPAAVTGVTSAAWAAYTIALSPPPVGPDLTVEPNLPPAFFTKAALAAAVLATFSQSWTPPVPPPITATPTQFGFYSQFSTPPKAAPRSINLNGSVAWSPQVPLPEWTGRFGFSNQVHKYEPAKRSVQLLDGFAQGPRVPEVQYQDGWRSKFQEPVLRPPRSVDLLGNVAWTAQAQAAAPVTYQDGWRSSFGEPTKTPARSLDLLGNAIWSRVPNVEYQDGWRGEFSKPVRLTVQPRLEGAVTWPGYGYSFVVVSTVTTEMWHTRWQDPPKVAPRSVALLDGTAQGPRVPDVQYQDGWRSEFSVPPRAIARNVSLLYSILVQGYPLPVQVVTYQDGWRSSFGEPAAYLQARRSIDLAGNITDMAPRVPDVQYQDGWRQEFSQPIGLTPRPRIEGAVSWPGIGYSVAQTATPAELAHIRWQDPPKAPARSIDLLGSVVWPAQVPAFEAIVTYGFSNQNHKYEPAHRSVQLLDGLAWDPQVVAAAPITVTTEMWHQRWPDSARAQARAINLLGNTIWAPRVPDREYQDGWRIRSNDPPHLFRVKPRLQGEISQGFPQLVRTPTQFGFWTEWRPVPWRASRSIALTGSIAFSFKEPAAAPPAATVGTSATFRFTQSPDLTAGAKPADTLGTRTDRGASMTKGAKPAETLSTRTDRGGSLTKGVKKPDA